MVDQTLGIWHIRTCLTRDEFIVKMLRYKYREEFYNIQNCVFKKNRRERGIYSLKWLHPPNIQENPR